MKCKCGKEIENVPPHLEGLANWVCKDCSNTPPSSSLVGISPSDHDELKLDVKNKRITAEHAA